MLSASWAVVGGGEVERAIADLSRRQYGAFSRAQVLSCGASPGLILRHCQSGEWVRLARAVYASTTVRPTWERQVVASTLVHESTLVAAAGTTAAVLHGVDGFRRGRPKLIVPHGSRAENPLADVKRSRHLRKADIVRVAGIPALVFERLVLDLAPTASKRELERLVDFGVLTGRLDPDRLIEVVGRLLRGSLARFGDLREILEERWTGTPPAMSELEADTYAMLDGAGFRGRYKRQVVPPSYEQAREGAVVDTLFDPGQVILEVDGRLWHARLEQWDYDHRRDAIALAHGYLTVRVTHRMVRRTPGTVVAALMPWIGRAA